MCEEGFMKKEIAAAKYVEFLMAICMAILILGMPQVGMANPSPAAQSYLQARAAFSQGDLTKTKTILEKYLLPKPKVSGAFWQESAKLLGVCYFLSGNRPGAETMFRKVLAENPKAALKKEDILDPGLSDLFENIRKQQGAAVYQAKRRSGITVKTNVDRATVFDGGLFVGPTNRFIELNRGTHELSISSEGYADAKQKVILRSGQTLSVKILLRKPEPASAPRKISREDGDAVSDKKRESKNREPVRKSAQGLDYDAALPVPKKGPSLSNEYDASNARMGSRTNAQQQNSGSAPQKTTAELLAPPAPANTYSLSSAFAPYPQNAPQMYQQQTSVPQAAYSSPPPVQQGSLYSQQPLANQQPYVQQNSQQGYSQPQYAPVPQPQYAPVPQPQYVPVPQPQYVPVPQAQYVPAPQTQYVAPAQPQYAAPQQQYVQPALPSSLQEQQRVSSAKKTALDGVKRPKNNNPALAFLPLGIGQFQKGETVKGLIFGGAQVGGIAFAIWSYMKESDFVKQEAAALANDDPNDPSTLTDNFDPNQAKAYKSNQQMNQYLGYGVAGAAWLISIVDGLSNSSPKKQRADNDIDESEDSVRIAAPAEKVHLGVFSYNGNIGLSFKFHF